MKKVLFATGNPSKAKRFSKGLLDKGIEVITLKDIEKDIEINEDGKNAIENAIIKAKAYAEVVDMPVFAMDDNLYLENVPEVFVRRVNGKRLTDEEMLQHYTGLVKEYGKEGKLDCKWVYGMAIINEKKEISTYTWEKGGFYFVEKISDKIRAGYPLDSISINKKLNKYFTDITPEDKKMLSEDESDVVEFIANSVL